MVHPLPTSTPPRTKAHSLLLLPSYDYRELWVYFTAKVSAESTKDAFPATPNQSSTILHAVPHPTTIRGATPPLLYGLVSFVSPSSPASHPNLTVTWGASRHYRPTVNPNRMPPRHLVSANGGTLERYPMYNSRHTHTPGKLCVLWAPPRNQHRHIISI